jgi:hypothetical protein
MRNLIITKKKSMKFRRNSKLREKIHKTAFFENSRFHLNSSLNVTRKYATEGMIRIIHNQNTISLILFPQFPLPVTLNSSIIKISFKLNTPTCRVAKTRSFICNERPCIPVSICKCQDTITLFLYLIPPLPLMGHSQITWKGCIAGFATQSPTYLSPFAYNKIVIFS